MYCARSKALDGFDRPPVFKMPYNPRYYPRLVGDAGLEKAMDLRPTRLISIPVAG
jgi:hypothetical protein